ncbi:cupin domain-containing protein [Alicyclobacillus dauci]|uniref:Cupin domain-containing protein n=1 Tax=Alicyclobacillus dauci TaxID=1475485 RepID=A0ABY6Z2E2_9BACL|nr:cupin domain-containing protein [Alicyclobacillus dauci]WAH36155.1 cupin domain-containing protein [Alicyclobacillus dauci]
MECTVVAPFLEKPAMPQGESTPLPAETGALRDELLKCPYLAIERISIAPGRSHSVVPHDSPSLVIGVSGEGSIRLEPSRREGLKAGDAWLLPSSASSVVLESKEELSVLRITY